mmetsp:Transcript_24394/g.35826  ORF Transcript_24394/g.35826 Transcript_24394/m.35826 type:complete len:132 (-) Transcript_24394:466-861(-)
MDFHCVNFRSSFKERCSMGGPKTVCTPVKTILNNLLYRDDRTTREEGEGGWHQMDRGSAENWTHPQRDGCQICFIRLSPNPDGFIFWDCCIKLFVVVACAGYFTTYARSGGYKDLICPFRWKTNDKSVRDW